MVWYKIEEEILSIAIKCKTIDFRNTLFYLVENKSVTSIIYIFMAR